MGWYRVVALLLNRTPTCPDCGGPTFAAGADMVHDLPPVLETRYQCPRCASEVVRRDVVDVWA
jgi:ribosomal protein L37AE/L43A